MKTTIKHLSDTRVLVTVQLGNTELENAEQVALKKLSKKVKVAGFRKGHVPLAVAQKNLDPNVLSQETLDNALSKAVAKAFLDNELQALERPSVEVKKYVPNSELEFTAECEIVPKVVLGDYKKLTVKASSVQVTAKEIDEVVGRIQKSFSEKKETKEAAKLGDETIIDFVGKKDDVAFDGGTGTDYALTLGSKSFIPGFEEALVGHAANETVIVPLTFPKDYQSKDLAGKKVTFEVVIKKVNQVILPELDDVLAAKSGPFTSIKDLRADIKRELKARKDADQLDETKDDLVKQLIAKSKVAVPKLLIDDQVQSIEQDLTQNLMYQGMTLEQYYESKGLKDRDEWVEKEANPVAEMRVQAGLVLAELSKIEKIKATADELAERINTFKTQYANKPDMAKRFDEPEIQREVANRLLTEKTVDMLVALNTK